MPDLVVSYLPIADLAPYPKNARTHSPEQIEQIAVAKLDEVEGEVVW
jgi:hypothetical protein